MRGSKAKEIKKLCAEFGLNKRQYRDYKKIYKSLPYWRRSHYIDELRSVLTALREQYGKI
tara:strand:+ start:1498 stop:1677 length:180 start_codon:yes stop_codon:yes gene_type:complete